jgi:uncharacterized membrane protein
MKKWFKKYKYEIVCGVQFFLIGYGLITGFWHIWLWLWFNIGLPIEWYSLVITAILGLLSAAGLFQWICKTEKKLEEA